MFSFGILVEGLVAMLLVLTIVYCLILNRRLKRLRADEESLRGTIAELVTATEIAERAIMGLKATADDCDKTLAQRLSQAESFSVDIERKIEAGDTIIARIAQITHAADATPTPQVPERPSRLNGLRQAALAAGFDMPGRGTL